jgi:phosphoribosylamine--glycine ligase
VVEFNCRLGDPEAQILALSDNTDWLEMMARKAGVHVKPEYRPSSHIGYHVVGIVAASSGYPFDKDEDFKFQIPRSALFGLSDVPGKNADEGAFAASVEETDEGEVYTSSGRVLCVVARAGCFSEARSRAYKKIEELTSGWNGVRYRSDIAKYVVSESS